MRVVEIGCGYLPGPAFEDADTYYATDIDKAAIHEIGFRPDIVRLVANATELPFEDASVDAMLARNVFGEPGLGLPYEEKSEGSKANRLKADELKTDILKEATRVLVSRGKLVIVEEYCPSVAGGYFSRLNLVNAGLTDLSISRADLKNVAPSNYEREVRQKNGARGREYKVWAATKA